MYEEAFHVPTDISNSSFLITGGAGFIGSNLVEYLVKYRAGKIRILDNLSTGFIANIQPYLSQPNIEFIEADINDLEACRNACASMDYIFHLAALGSVPRSIENPIATNNANVGGFLNMLVAARDVKVKRVVYASSSSVYGDSEILPKQEEIIGKPLSPYGVSKLVNELYAHVFSNIYSMEIIGLRYFNIFGPRQNPKGAYAAAIPLFIDALLNNKSLFINGDGQQTRDFTFVENAVQANIKAMLCTNKNALNKVFNIAVAERTSVHQLYMTLKKLTASNVNATFRNQRAGDVQNSLADISKAKSILGYEPKVKMEEGLKLTLEWFEKGRN